MALHAVLSPGVAIIAFYEDKKLHFGLLEMDNQQFLSLVDSSKAAPYSGDLINVPHHSIQHHRAVDEVTLQANRNKVFLDAEFKLHSKRSTPELIPCFFNILRTNFDTNNPSSDLSRRCLDWYVSHENPQLCHFPRSKIFGGRTYIESADFDRQFRSGDIISGFSNETTSVKIMLIFDSSTGQMKSSDGRLILVRKDTKDLSWNMDGITARVRCQLGLSSNTISARLSGLRESINSSGSNCMSSIGTCIEYISSNNIISKINCKSTNKSKIINNLLEDHLRVSHSRSDLTGSRFSSLLEGYVIHMYLDTLNAKINMTFSTLHQNRDSMTELSEPVTGPSTTTAADVGKGYVVI